ncbi:MAG: hypothetical protein RL199_821 [Pseudomonadota bacterium]|jgi:aminopeptidase N
MGEYVMARHRTPPASRAPLLRLGAVAVLSCAAACAPAASGERGGADAATVRPEVAVDEGRDILQTDLALNLATREGTATLTLAASTSRAASFEVGDLSIDTVEDEAGPLKFRTDRPARLDVGVPATGAPVRLTVRYRFQQHAQLDGWLPASGVTFLWPYFCGNLFPCHSAPAEGGRFSLTVKGVAPGLLAVHPDVIPADAPAYMPAIAVGAYTRLDLGRTSAGTRVSAWHLPGQSTKAKSGTAHLRDVFDFYERTYGPYLFGDEAGSVSADWAGGSFGGMEHHPFWHVGKDDFGSEEVHAHEAAHGWFGDGVRIACWEDFVLSEGLATYLSTRGLSDSGVDLWPQFECDLKDTCDPASGPPTAALPSTCGVIDLLHDPLWSLVPYMKGAFFLREVADVLGVEAVDRVLAAFYAAHAGRAAHMQDLLDALDRVAGGKAAEVASVATKWLRTAECPSEVSELCPSK